MRGHGRRTSCLLAALAGVAGLIAQGAAVTTAVAEEGQIVILRDVPPRIAYREAPPAPPFAVSTTPDVDVSATREIGPGVMASVPGASLISDLEAAGVSANTSVLHGLDDLAGGVDRAISVPLGGGLTGASTGATARALQRLPGQLGVVAQGRLVGGGGGVQRATAGLGQTISHALVPH